MFTASQLGNLSIAYAEATGTTVATLGRLLFGDHRFFKKLISGEAGCTIGNAERASLWFIKNWPSDVPWPADVPDRRAEIDAAAD